MITIEEFVKKKREAKRENQRFILPKYKDDIKKMRDMGMTFTDIQDYLKLKGVKVTLSSITRFYHRNFEPVDTKVNETPPVSKPVKTEKPKNKNPSWAPDDLDLSADKLI